MRIPSDEEIRVLHERVAPAPAVLDLVWTHSLIVSDIAAQLLPASREKADAALVRAGCLAHDIGVYLLADERGVIDHESYIRHGLLGYELLREEGFPEELCRFASRHTGVGLTAADITAQGLPLPPGDYTAQTPEELLVMYADKFHTKTEPPQFVTRDAYARGLRRFGAGKVAAFQDMAAAYGEPDLTVLSARYGHSVREWRAQPMPAGRGARSGALAASPRDRAGNLGPMREETIAEFLGQLAARVPAPGGGATAALHAAQAAALLAMVARYSDGPRYDPHREVISGILAEADALVTHALGLAEADARAFGAVAEAYKLPKESEVDAKVRSAAIEAALGVAARPPADVVLAALRLAELAERLLPVGNRNVLTDVAAAAEAARAAATTGAINVEVNLRGIKDSALREQLAGTAALTTEVGAIADRVTAAVRKEITS